MASTRWGGLEAQFRLEGALRRFDDELLELLHAESSVLSIDHAAAAPVLVAWLQGVFARESERRAGADVQALAPLAIPADQVVASLNAAATLYVRCRDIALATEHEGAVPPAVFFGRLWRAIGASQQLEPVPSISKEKTS
jgi:hypothetical protein